MHHVQRDIIYNLAQGLPLRFSELQPKGVPNNAFSYHLKKLLESGYIVSTSMGYMATRKALKIVRYSEDQDRRHMTPSLITVVYVTNRDGKVLLLKRRNKPFAGWYGLPSGQIHLGEKLELAARRELFEKTGIHSHKPLDFVGVLDFRYLARKSSDLFVHAVAFVYKFGCVSPDEVILNQESKYGTLDWSGLTRDMILPEVHTITKIVREKSPIISSVDFEEPAALPISKHQNNV